MNAMERFKPSGVKIEEAKKSPYETGIKDDRVMLYQFTNVNGDRKPIVLYYVESMKKYVVSFFISGHYDAERNALILDGVEEHGFDELLDATKFMMDWAMSRYSFSNDMPHDPVIRSILMDAISKFNNHLQ